MIQALTADSTIGGGANNVIQLSADHSTIGGGGNNIIQTNASYSTVSGGRENSIQPGSTYSAIGGGWQNSVQSNSYLAVIAGGNNNVIQSNATFATIGGGAGNIVQSNSQFASIPGGNLNSAASYAFAAGNQAKANHSGAFVWADSQAVDFPSASSNEFAVRASGGVRLVTGGAGLTVDGQPVISSLPANIVYVNSNQTFTASNTFAGVVKATNGNNSFTGSFAGNGAGLTNLNASQLAAGIVPLAVLSGITSNQLNATTWQLATNLNGGNAALASNVLAGISITNVFITNSTFAGNGAGLTNLSVASLPANIAFVSSNQTFTASNTFAGVVTMTNGSNTLVGTFTGNGGGLTNLNISSFTGTIADARLSSNVALLNTNQTFTGSNNFNGALVATNLNSRFAGNGGGLTNLNTTNIVGTIADPQLSANVALLGGAQTFSGAKAMTNAGNTFVGAFTGNGGGLTNLNLGSLSGSNFWTLTGNAGTDSTTNFIGTTDSKDFTVRVNNTRALRVQPVNTSAANIIAGYSGNDITNGVIGSVIAGGGGSGATNRITENYSVIGGGVGNLVGDGDNNANSAQYSLVAGGYFNAVIGSMSAIGGGSFNTNNGAQAVVAGGQLNRSTNSYAAVGGGHGNLAGGNAATVPGGEQNQALGNYSFAAGRNAQANHDGTFVWADTIQTTFTSTTTNQFLIRAQNGVGINTASPATALDVNGTATVTGFRLSTTPIAGALLTSDASGNGTWSTNVTANAVASGAVGTAGIQSNSITGALIANGTITSNDIANAQVVRSLNGLRDDVILAPGTNIVFATNSNTLTISASAPASNSNYWSLTGNAGTDPTTNFIGTTDNKAFVVRVNNRRGLRLESVSDGVFSSVNVLAGNTNNTIDAGAIGATIAGGGNNATPFSFPNLVHGDYGTVGGGVSNDATNRATVGGGDGNSASGIYSTVPGGQANIAAGNFSFAAGKGARALHSGSFVWADASGGSFSTANSNTFIIRATNGVGINVTNPAPGYALHVGGNTFVEGDLLVVKGILTELPYLSGGDGSGNKTIRVGAGYPLTTDVTLWNRGSASLMNLVAGAADFSDSLNMNNNPVNLAGSFNGLGYNTNFGSQTINGPVLYGLIGGALGVNNNGTKSATLFWNSTGVSINTNNSGGASLYVQGSRTGGWGQPVAVCENISGGDSSSPALLVQGNGNMVDGVLAVRNTGGGVLAQFGTALGWQVTFTTNGYIYAEGDVYARGVKLTSDRNAKEDFTKLDAKTVLAKVAALPVSEWKYKNEQGVRHIGPVAQDFQSAFQLSDDDKHISTVDEGGVALAAIQGLNEKLSEKDAQIQDLKTRLEKLEQLMNNNTGAAK